MKTWIKRSLIGVAATATLLGGFAAYAHRHDGMRLGWRAVTAAEAAPMQGRAVEYAARKLDLDAAQKAKLGALTERLRETRNAMAGASFDRGRVNTLVQAQLAMAGAQSPALINAAADFYDSLRPTQQADLREMLAKRRRHGRGEN